jgi:hypothetical protein
VTRREVRAGDLRPWPTTDASPRHTLSVRELTLHGRKPTPTAQRFPPGSHTPRSHTLPPTSPPPRGLLRRKGGSSHAPFLPRVFSCRCCGCIMGHVVTGRIFALLHTHTHTNTHTHTGTRTNMVVVANADINCNCQPSLSAPLRPHYQEFRDCKLAHDFSDSKLSQSVS